VPLNQDYYSDNEEMLAKLEAGATGYDLVVPTGNAVETLLRRQALRPLDKTEAAEPRRTSRPSFREPWYDPGMRYAVPYATTVTLLGYNARRLAELACRPIPGR
jgi:spermidine/putrescine transport system substrate-binding protein